MVLGGWASSYERDSGCFDSQGSMCVQFQLVGACCQFQRSKCICVPCTGGGWLIELCGCWSPDKGEGVGNACRLGRDDGPRGWAFYYE